MVLKHLISRGAFGTILRFVLKIYIWKDLKLRVSTYYYRYQFRRLNISRNHSIVKKCGRSNKSTNFVHCFGKSQEPHKILMN